MDQTEVIAPLLGVILGAILTGAGVLYRQREERKRIIAVALADLLEVRHELLGMERALTYLRSKVTLPPEFLPMLTSRFGDLNIVDGELQKRYATSITLVAGFEPILGYRLRSKGNIPGFLASIRKTCMEEGVNPTDFYQYEEMLRKAIGPTVDRAILELAGHHSRGTLKNVESLFRTGLEIPADAAKFVDDLVAFTQST